MVCAVPVYIFVAAGSASPPPRLTPPVIAVSSLPSVTVPAYDDAVPVLVYHEISPVPSTGHSGVTLTAFARQMAALHAAGFHTISVAQFIGFLHGTARLPVRPLLLTFQGGLGSDWRAADPILAEYDFRAVAFVISDLVGTHGFYYLRTDELRAMIRSGRWDIEAEADLAHAQVQTDAFGDRGPALTNRAWLPKPQRLETQAVFVAGVREGLDAEVAALHSYGVHPQLLAYPTSLANTPTNDPSMVPTIRRLVARRFPITLLDVDGSRFLSRYVGASPHELSRLEIRDSTTATSLLGRLRRLVPMAPQVSGFHPDQQWSYVGGAAGSPHGSLRGGVFRLRTPLRDWSAAYLMPARSELWSSYRASVTFGDLGRAASGTSATLLFGGGAGVRYALTVSAVGLALLADQPGAPPRAMMRARIRARAAHRAVVMLVGRRLVVRLDGRRIATRTLPQPLHGGIGLGAWRQLATSPQPSFADLAVHAD